MIHNLAQQKPVGVFPTRKVLISDHFHFCCCCSINPQREKSEKVPNSKGFEGLRQESDMPFYKLRPKGPQSIQEQNLFVI